MSTTEKDASGGLATDSKIAATDQAGNLTEAGASFRSRNRLDPAEEYKMDHKRRGLALIFNQESFTSLKLRFRDGSTEDRNNLERRFKELNFEVQAHDDLTRKEILAKISEAGEADHLHADCFVCVFLSHGEKDEVHAFDDTIRIQEITALFKGDKCRSLVGKPKIFILQACRGDQYDLAVTPMAAGDSEAKENEVIVEAGVVNTLPAGPDFLMCYSVAEGYQYDLAVTPMAAVYSEAEENEVIVGAGVVNTLPVGPDFLMCYSVAEGYYSIRNRYKGAWYIQDLCEALEKFGDSLEFTELLTLVNRMVSLRQVEHAKDPKDNGKKQLPCFASVLTKKLYFRTKP